jgi:hypothetical protein
MLQSWCPAGRVVSLMSNPKPLLDDLVRQGKPLAEVVVIPSSESDSASLAKLLDELAPDISCEIVPGYFQAVDGPLRYEIRFEATKEAVEREFGWVLSRMKIYDSSNHNHKYPDAYCWREENQPQFYPLSLRDRIKEMGLTQPGRDDNGAADNVQYQIRPG